MSRFARIPLVLILGFASSAQDRRVVMVSNNPRRVALVAGNAAYPNTPLRNAVNDARDFAAALRELGFAVVPGCGH
jgi:hypothetical protein